MIRARFESYSVHESSTEYRRRSERYVETVLGTIILGSGEEAAIQAFGTGCQPRDFYCNTLILLLNLNLPIYLQALCNALV